MLVTVENPTCLNVRVDKFMYGHDVVHKCFYWYAGRYGIDIVEESEEMIISLVAKEPVLDMDELIHGIQQDLIDFKTRSIITKETHHIREMLIAKAFAHGGELEGLPAGELSDPVGFDPTLIRT